MSIQLADQIDYYRLYCNVMSPDFLNTLQLEKSELTAFSLLMAPSAEERSCFIPNLDIENLVHTENTPYQALRTLHTLREKRLIFYELTETEIHEQTTVGAADLIDKAYKKAMDDDEETKELAPASVYQEIQQEKKYERYAVLNIEYPVVYHCLKEESALRGELDLDIDLQLMYTAIRGDALAVALRDADYPIILEFLQYVQSLFNLPLTEYPEKGD